MQHRARAYAQLHEYIKKQPGMEVLADELRDPRQVGGPSQCVLRDPRQCSWPGDLTGKGLAAMQALIDGYLEADVDFLKDMDSMERQVVMVDGTEIDITADLRNSGATACTGPSLPTSSHAQRSCSPAVQTCRWWHATILHTGCVV